MESQAEGPRSWSIGQAREWGLSRAALGTLAEHHKAHEMLWIAKKKIKGWGGLSHKTQQRQAHADFKQLFELDITSLTSEGTQFFFLSYGCFSLDSLPHWICVLCLADFPLLSFPLFCELLKGTAFPYLLPSLRYLNRQIKYNIWTIPRHQTLPLFC